MRICTPPTGIIDGSHIVCVFIMQGLTYLPKPTPARIIHRITLYWNPIRAAVPPPKNICVNRYHKTFLFTSSPICFKSHRIIRKKKNRMAEDVIFPIWALVELHNLHYIKLGSSGRVHPLSCTTHTLYTSRKYQLLTVQNGSHVPLSHTFFCQFSFVYIFMNFLS